MTDQGILTAALEQLERLSAVLGDAGAAIQSTVGELDEDQFATVAVTASAAVSMAADRLDSVRGELREVRDRLAG